MQRNLDERRTLLMKKAGEIRTQRHLDAIMAQFPEAHRAEVLAAVEPKLMKPLAAEGGSAVSSLASPILGVSALMVEAQRADKARIVELEAELAFQKDENIKASRQIAELAAKFTDMEAAK